MAFDGRENLLSLAKLKFHRELFQEVLRAPIHDSTPLLTQPTVTYADEIYENTAHRMSADTFQQQQPLYQESAMPIPEPSILASTPQPEPPPQEMSGAEPEMPDQLEYDAEMGALLVESALEEFQNVDAEWGVLEHTELMGHTPVEQEMVFEESVILEDRLVDEMVEELEQAGMHLDPFHMMF